MSKQQSVLPTLLYFLAPLVIYGLYSFNIVHFFTQHNAIRGFPRAYVDRARVLGIAPHSIKRQSHAKAFFAPEDNLQKVLLSLIETENKSIHIAMYLFTDYKIAHALESAYKRGVDVKVVADQVSVCSRSPLELLQESGMPVYVYRGDGTLMHDKFVIFGSNRSKRPLVWTGSYNFTKQERDTNQENALLLDDMATVRKYKKQFKKIKEMSTKLMGNGEKGEK